MGEVPFFSQCLLYLVGFDSNHPCKSEVLCPCEFDLYYSGDFFFFIMSPFPYTGHLIDFWEIPGKVYRPIFSQVFSFAI